MSQSAAGHSELQEQAAAWYALGLLEGEERTAFEVHLASCLRCQQLVQDDLETVGRLLEAAPSVESPVGFRQRLLGQVEREFPTAAIPARSLQNLRPPARPWRRLAAVAALLLLALTGAIFAGRHIAASQALLTAPLQAHDRPGAVTIVVRANGVSELNLRGVPDPPPGRVYQTWVVDEQGRRWSAGVADSGNETYELERPVIGRVVEVTEEPAPSSSVPTTRPLFAGRVAR